MKHAIGMKEQGFTLLELLVVITLLAVLSVGALVAYDGVGANAQATATAANVGGADRAIRAYRSVTGNYPDQWDNLAALDASAPFSDTLMADVTKKAFGAFNMGALSGTATGTAIQTALDAVDIEALQSMAANATVANLAPNLQHNEGSNAAADEESLFAGRVSVMPGGSECSVGVAANTLGNVFDGTTIGLAAASRKINKINDALETDVCHFVLALGFGHDAAQSTFNSSVAVASAPTQSNKDINPATHYARYVALFWMGSDTSQPLDNLISDTEILSSPRLIAVVGADGKNIDEALASATKAN